MDENQLEESVDASTNQDENQPEESIDASTIQTENNDYKSKILKVDTNLEVKRWLAYCSTRCYYNDYFSGSRKC